MVRMAFIGRKHPSRDVIFSGQNLAKIWPQIISLHDVLEPLKQALLASRDVIISSQICGSNLQKVFTLGDGCWLPIHAESGVSILVFEVHRAAAFWSGVCKNRLPNTIPEIAKPRV